MEKETYILRVNNWEDLKEESWSGATQTLESIEEKGLEEDFINLLNSILQEDIYNGNYWTDTRVNDFIWFDTDFIEESLNCKLWEA